jgi:hypothetical protein
MSVATEKARGSSFAWTSARAIAALSAVLLAAPAPARAETNNAAGAEALFRDGKRLLEEHDYAGACSKLAESFRLDPATGTLLALAMCHEAQGRIATAWGEYTDAAARAKTEGRADREEGARARADQLEVALSTLDIIPAPETERIPGFVVARDGAEIGRAEFHTPMPVDPGEHTIVATAPGRVPWSIKVVVGRSAERLKVPVPPLQKPNASLGPVRIAGLVAGAAGVLGLGVGAAFAVHAIERNDASNAPGGCLGDSCPGGDFKQARLDARSAGDVATVAFIAGGALLAAGAGMFLFGRPRDDAGVPVHVVPVIGADQASIFLGGSFR